MLQARSGTVFDEINLSPKSVLSILKRKLDRPDVDVHAGPSIMDSWTAVSGLHNPASPTRSSAGRRRDGIRPKAQLAEHID